MDIFFVHFWKFQNTFGKSIICEHNEKLASHHKKNNFDFLTIKFFIFGADSLGVFFVIIF